MAIRSVGVLLVVMSLGIAGCAEDSKPAPSEEAASTPSPMPTEVEVGSPKLPKISTVEDLGGEAISATHRADWVLVAFGRAWVSGLGTGIGYFDVTTGQKLGTVNVPEHPCAAPDAGFGSLWTATCMGPGLSRIDPKSGKVTAHIDVAVPANGESSIGVGEGAVWAIADGDDCFGCELVRIDPRSMETQSFPVSDGGTAVRAGEGGVWITNVVNDSVEHVDPDSGELVATIPVAGSPRFFDVGLGGVWVMAQSPGALCQIDPTTDQLVACNAIDQFGTEGGDLTVGEGYVWFRGSTQLVAQIDPKAGEVIRRIGKAAGSGSAAAGSGQLWISAHDVATIYRIPLE